MSAGALSRLEVRRPRRVTATVSSGLYSGSLPLALVSSDLFCLALASSAIGIASSPTNVILLITALLTIFCAGPGVLWIGELPWGRTRFGFRPIATVDELYAPSRWSARPDRIQQVCKRTMDLVLILALAIPLLILLSAISIAMRLTSRGPVFYRHARIGKDGECFDVWKFRSMVVNSGEVFNAHLAVNPDAKVEWELTQKLKDDPRVSFLGRWLRRWSVDELPQLWNVIRGEMSLVGPRPITREELCRYGDSSDAYKSVRPGITGLWQVSGRSNISYQERVSLDECYVRTRSVRLDVRILIRTIPALLTGEGAC